MTDSIFIRFDTDIKVNLGVDVVKIVSEVAVFSFDPEILLTLLFAAGVALS